MKATDRIPFPQRLAQEKQRRSRQPLSALWFLFERSGGLRF